MHLTAWHAEPGSAFGSAFATHLHGRDLEVVVEPSAVAPADASTEAPADTSAVAPADASTEAPANTSAVAPADASTEAPADTSAVAPADAAAHRWHWTVTSPHGALLAEGHAASRDAAELAAEDEATAVHPPTVELLDRLLG